MLDQKMRRVKEKMLRPLFRLFAPLSPNLISLCAFVLGLACAWSGYRGMYGWGILFGFCNRFLDGMDGLVARERGKQTDFGGYLDILLDFVIYAAIPAGLVIGAPSDGRFIALIVLLSSFYLNAASWIYLAAILEKRAAGAKERGEMTTVTMPAGLIGGTETIFFYVLFFLFPNYWIELFGLMASLVGVGIIWRLWWSWNVL